MAKDIKSFLQMLKADEVEFVDFRFTDIKGTFHHITYLTNHVDADLLKNGLSFDGSSIVGWKEIEESDMLIVPDVTSSFFDPYSLAKTICVICDVIDPATGNSYSRDPRSIAKAAIAVLQKTKVADIAYFGPELEFFVFDDVRYNIAPNDIRFYINHDEGEHNSGAKLENGNLAHRPGVKGGYFPIPPCDSLNDLRAEMCTHMKLVGLNPMLHHHEVAASQCEIGIEYASLLEAADNVQKFKYVVKNVAHAYNKTATFMPKPIYNDNGCGMHTHQSLWRKDTNLFAGNAADGELSETALYYIGGIIKHAKAINAFTNPSTNSYKRLVPGFEAPVNLAYSAKNRSAAIRIPYSLGKSAKRIEVRFPDPSANPYLAFAAMLLAGLDGIKNKIHPGEAVNKNLYNLSSKEKSKIPSVCGSLKEALESLNKDRNFLTESGVFDDDFIDNYIALKMADVQELETLPHPVEFKLYYSV
jgi:glutamine synthetase